MRHTGPRQRGVSRRLLAAVALVTVLLLAANPAPLLVPFGESNAPLASTADGRPSVQDVCPGRCQFTGGLSLASIFPITSDREVPRRTDQETVGLADDRAGELFDVLGSETARTLLQQLSAEPRTASELSEDVDTSLQNVHYHLENLREASAIAEVDVEYSSRGREMSVYVATCRPQVLVHDVE